MNQLESIWKIEQTHKSIKELESEKESIEKSENLDDVLLRIREREYDITHIKTQLEVDDIKIQRLNQKLKQISFKLKEINKKLYSGKITNVQKLTSLQDEEKELKEDIEKTEDQILELLDIIEHNTEKLYALEKEQEKLNKNFQESQEQNKEKLIKIENKLIDLNQEIKKLKTDLDDEILNKYEHLSKKKTKAIARIDGDKCTGCHMSIPLSVISKIKKGNKLVNCDNCGRILYYEADEEERQ
ncbi:hypothetical protein GOQ27_00510 [Clostridium sp. D2Q-11]|uniref:C4-type zinc ribbon domain-containing protein n=1 Tax=Anaeromonas frigoriresistens TaxID=2683708 RepID=A0A942UU93_9FIRM|nr:C4-type zinc ribbon domain-containing protein [Anaeromonas frigoriresistens]MBS4536921.1 hypothetical protein [Anaeromonas frigoriresistens]